MLFGAVLCSQTERTSSRRIMVVIGCIDHETADMMNATLNRQNDPVASLITYGGGFLLLLLGSCSMWKSVYIRSLENVMRPSATKVYPNQNFSFQQDNCFVHTSHRVATWFQDQNINVLDQPSRSEPDKEYVVVFAKAFAKNRDKFIIMDRSSLLRSLMHGMRYLRTTSEIYAFPCPIGY
jgi:hypothetical protein